MPHSTANDSPTAERRESASAAPDAPGVEVAVVETASDASMPLTLCPSGCRVTIHLDEVEDGDRSMLEALGLEDGGEVEVCQVGSPCILRVSSTRVGVCREVAGRLRATISATIGGHSIQTGD